MQSNIEEKNQGFNNLRFISNAPCGEDLFESKSQNRIANNICNILKTDESCKIIGIDGGWGSGKSNLVKIANEKLKNDKFHFFIYDAWGHQEDLQRRSILEELTEDLTEKSKILNFENWKPRLKKLLSKSKETEKKSIPSLSYGIIIAALVIITTPIFKILADNISNKYFKVIVISIPILALCFFYLKYIYNEIKITGWNRYLLKNAATKLFYLYQKQQIEDITFETISEDEPSVRKFRSWMQDISKDLKANNYNLVIVFDNMDRLPKEKVQELWSSIHTFFAENYYDNIKVIVPFDRKHIENSFNEGNEDAKYGNDFINKTFNIVYRVSPPILSDWKRFFEQKWNEAFDKTCNVQDYELVIRIYDVLADAITPRRIIAFVNEFVSIKQINEAIPFEYIALFIMKKQIILSNPFNEIVAPTYLDGMSYKYQYDENLAKNIGALVYQIESGKAIQVIYTNKLERAFNTNDVESANTISQSTEFYDIFNKALPAVSSIENAILCLDKLDKEIPLQIWEDLYLKMHSWTEDSEKLKDYQVILLKKISKKEKYLERILTDFKKSNKFNSNDYFYSVNELKKLEEIELFTFSIADKLPKIETTVEDFIPFVRESKVNYKYYQISCNNIQLDKFLSEISATEENLKKIDFIPFIVDGYKMEKFITKIEENINSNKVDPSNKNIVEILFKLYRETSKNRKLKPLLEDAQLYSFKNILSESDDFYYDIICMRLARLNDFSSSYNSYFNDALNKADKITVEKICSKIGFYINYDEMLLNVNLVTFPIFREVTKNLILNSYTPQRLSMGKVLQKFRTIVLEGQIDALDLIKSLNKWNCNTLNLKNINVAIPDIFFFENAVKIENNLTKFCIIALGEYLDTKNLEEWKGILQDNSSYELKCSIILGENYSYTQEAIDAIKLVLKDIADEGIVIPQKTVWDDIIKKLKLETLEIVFTDLRDRFISNSKMNVDLFSFFGDWLFNYAHLEKHSDVLQKVITFEIIRNEYCRSLISEHKEKFKKIFDNNSESIKNEFKSTIRSILDSDDGAAIKIIATELGVHQSKKKEDEKPML